MILGQGGQDQTDDSDGSDGQGKEEMDDLAFIFLSFFFVFGRGHYFAWNFLTVENISLQPLIRIIGFGWRIVWISTSICCSKTFVHFDK